MKLKLLCVIAILSKVSTLYGSEYYSENQQDKYVYENFLKGKKTGFFVDIGAHEGIQNSNSYYFEKLGWKGICFEPDPRTYQALKNNRNCVLYNCAVGSREGVEKFIQHPCTWVSGLDRTYCDKHRKCWQVPKGEAEKYFIDVKVVELNNILQELEVNTIDFLSIDTEGAEKDILMSIDYDQIYIAVMAVENKYHDSSIPEFLKKKGFNCVKRLHRDEIYINTKKR